MTPTRSWQNELAQLVEERIGIRLQLQEPCGTVGPFVLDRLGELGMQDPIEYVDLLLREAHPHEEFARLTTICTNGQTSFFRDAEQLETIVKLMAARCSQTGRPVKVWSAGCSSGDEPYSLAILAQEHQVRAEILATDINAHLLRTAQEGLYNAWTLRNVPPSVRAAYFSPDGNNYRIQQRIAARVRFHRHNLLGDDMPQPIDGAGGWDFILCRHVFIYYARPTVSAILSRMSEVLDPKGHIFLSASESLHDVAVPLVARSVLQRVAYVHSNADSAPGQLSIATHDATGRPSPSRCADQSRKIAPIFANAVRSIELGEFDQARRTLQAVLDVENDHVIARLTLGHVHLQAHQFEEALRAYTDAQMRAPLSAEAHYFEGVVHRKAGAHERAAESFRRALFLEPTFWPASFLLAGIYDRQNRRDLGLREVQHVLDLLKEGAPVPFRSYTQGLTGLALSAAEAQQICEKRIERGRHPQAGTKRGHRSIP